VERIAAMPRNYLAEPRNRVKHEDRAITDESWMREFLRDGHWGAMATVQDGQPFINTNLFVYDERKHSACTHAARYGQDYRSISESDLKRTSVYRVDIAEWCGKRKSVDAGLPGSYFFRSEGCLHAHETPEPD
jgi:nitroimidazol reductase NimA-like FMN-containing flavoprotein (pyridoxamine 5'-phosphate oxidase superfamily)